MIVWWELVEEQIRLTCLLGHENGLRPLAVHYDNTWNTAIATENIRKVLTKLDIDLYTHVTNNKEMDDIYRAFFLAGVPEIEAPPILPLLKPYTARRTNMV